MIKIFLSVVLTFITINLCAQAATIVTGGTKDDKYYIASLPKNSSDNYHKLRIDIFGGTWYNFDLGTRTYSISSRNGNIYTDNLVRISQEQKGGSVSRFTLKVYETPTVYDIVLESNDYCMSIVVQAWLTDSKNYGIITPITAQSIRPYTVGSNIDITKTNKVEFINILSTDNRGNIGIGTTTPDQKLTVKGKIHAEEIIVDLKVPLADYVFKPDYKLMPLTELEQFVKTNSHLPEIPAADEVVESGLGIGEMQNKLLQKIEELTLYVIDLKKESQMQESRIGQLEEENRKLKATQR